MATKYAIETVYKLIDNITMPLDKIGVKGKTVGRALKNEFTKTEQQLANIGTKLKSFAKGAALVGIGAIGVGLGVATKQFIEFDSSLHAASAAYSDMNPKSVDFGDKLKTLGKAARDVAAVTEFNAQQTAQGLSTLARTGLDSVNAIALLPNISDLATAGMVGIDDAVGMATSTLNIFGKNLDEFGNKITDPKKIAGNMQYISDILAQTADMANHSVQDVVGAASTGGSMFTTANQSIENFGALTAVLADINKRGTEAGTNIRNIMLRLSAPAKAGEGALKKLNIATRDSKGNLLNIVDIVKQFETSMKGLGSAEQAEYLDAIFGKQNVEAATAIINAGSGKLLEYTSRLENSFGAAAQKAGVMRGSLQNQINILMSGLTELGFKFVDAFADKGSDAIKKLTDTINSFDPAPIIDFLTTAFNTASKIVGVLWNMRGAIATAIVAWVSFKTVMVAAVIASRIYVNTARIVRAGIFAVTLVTKGQTAALATLKTGSKAAQAATAAFTVGQKIAAFATSAWTAAVNFLNAAFIASPIGWIVLGIGALIAAIILCIKYWDAIAAALSRAWEWIKKNQEAILNLVTIFTGPFGVIISIVREFWNEWDRITQAFTNGGIIAGLKQIGATILSALLAPLQGIFELIAKIPYIGEPFKAMAGGIEKFRDTIKGVDGAEAINKAQGAVSYGGVGQAGTGGSAPELVPVSPAQQLAYYSRQDSYQHAEISVRAEQGTQARISKPPKSPAFNLVASGSY